MGTQSKDSQFGKLVEEVRACKKCDRMCNSVRVLNNSAGNLNADLFFIGEAPGRLGADRTQIPLHGDKTGRNFEAFLLFAGISRNDIFVTNAVLCNPKDKAGNNSTPTPSEAANCHPFLRQQIELVNPKIVVPLGATALQALSGIEQHAFSLSQNVRKIHAWFGRLLIPLYHPSQQAMIHRNFEDQQFDYQFVSEQWRHLEQGSSCATGETD